MLYMHVGRGKAGSTTIQRFMMDNRLSLQRRGIVYPLPRPPWIRHIEIKDAIYRASADQRPLEDFIAQMKAEPQLRYVLSDEGLLQVKAEGDLSRAERLIATAPDGVRAIVYIRNYGPWVVSLYGQRAKKGLSRDDFDQYWDSMWPRVSVIPRLEHFAALVGWENMRVRSLDPANLVGGSLVTDVLDAIDESDTSGINMEVGNQNVARTWMEIEFRRAVANCFGPDETPHEEVVRQVMKRFSRAVSKLEMSVPPAAYLTPQQARAGAELFNRDVAIINERTGSQIPEVGVGGVPERPFLPSVSELPEELRDAMRRVLRPVFVRAAPKRSRPGLRRLRDMLT